MVEHCSVNTQAMGANPVEVTFFFSGLFAIAHIGITPATVISLVN